MDDRDLPYSEQFVELHDKFYRIEWFQGPGKALAFVKSVLEDHASYNLTAEERKVFEWHQTHLERVLDLSYKPPPHQSEDEIYPLLMKGWRSTGEDRLRHCWQYLEYTTPGTDDFLNALSEVADAAAKAGHLALAKRVTETFLLFDSVMDSASALGLTRDGGRTATKPIEGLDYRRVSLPWEAALIGIRLHPDACWARILEHDVQEAEFGRDIWGYKQAVRALLDYYQKHGDSENAARIRRDHPEAAEEATA